MFMIYYLKIRSHSFIFPVLHMKSLKWAKYYAPDMGDYDDKPNWFLVSMMLYCLRSCFL